MEDPRPEKVAVVDEVKERFEAADAAVLTDYRGLDVSAMAELRTAVRDAGGDYKIYKNNLVRFAVSDLGLELQDLLVGPTAIAFITRGEDGAGDPVLLAKALRDFSKSNDNLEIKGGILRERLLSPAEIDQLAKVAPRDELLARFAGGLAAPMQRLAGLLQAVPRDFAYGLRALIEEGGGPDAPAPAPEPEAEAEPEPEAEAEPEPEAEPEASADRESDDTQSDDTDDGAEGETASEAVTEDSTESADDTPTDDPESDPDNSEEG